MSSNFVRLTPLINTEEGAYCHMLEIDNTKILINCGTDNKLDVSKYQSVLDIILQCDCILLTSFNINCIGALPYVMEKGYYNKIYSSVPIKVLGKIVFDEQQKILKGSTFFSSEHFEKITEIKYSQPAMINNIEVCAYNSGCSLGGCTYKITKGLESTLIAYNINHRKENHLDGLNLSAITSPTFCIINSNGVFTENVSVVKRDENFKMILTEAMSQKMKVIVPVKYTRFLEIALLINNIVDKTDFKAICFSYYGKKFAERARSMVEWAGEKVTELFTEEKINPFELENIEFVKYYNLIPESDIIIVVDEELIGPAVSTLINELNDSKNLIVFTDFKTSETVRTRAHSIKSYKFNLSKKESDKEVKKSDIKEQEFESISDEIYEVTHWSDYKYEVWGVDTFPSVIKRRAYDDYGEYIDKSIFIKDIVVPEKIEVEEVSEDSMIEEIVSEIVSEGSVLNYKTITLDYMGVSDINSCKNILESLYPKKLVCVGEDAHTRSFFYHFFKYNSIYEDVLYCRGKTILSSDATVSLVKLSKDFCNLEYKKIGSEFIGRFKGVLHDNSIEYTGETASAFIGNVDMNELRRGLIESNLRVEQDDNGLLVEDCVWVKTKDDELIIDGNDTEVFYAVRNVIYKNIALV